MYAIANGTKVKHKTRTGVYAIILDCFYSSNDGGLYYHVDIYSEKTNKMTYHKGNWMADNCISIEAMNNKQAKVFLERDY